MMKILKRLLLRTWGLDNALKLFEIEASAARLKYGFENLNFHEIIAMTDWENVASQKILEKIGFAQRGIETFNGEKALVYLAKNLNNIQ